MPKALNPGFDGSNNDDDHDDVDVMIIYLFILCLYIDIFKYLFICLLFIK